MNKEEFAFYEIMKYPIPTEKELFSTKKNNKEIIKSDNFSRNEKNKYMEEYITYINKYAKIFKNLPFIKEIFLCNSITFNALNKESDIDLFFIVKKNNIRKARFFSLLIFSILGLKRFKKTKRKKFCLTFYITENKENLYSISLPKTDIYLAYWISHLVPIYLENNNESNFFNNNLWIKNILPNIKKNKINLWQKTETKKGFLKKLFEILFWNILLTRICEIGIKLLRVPILIYKKRKLGKISKNIIINDTMLKFYKDERSKIQKIYEIKHQQLSRR